jgi:hypothetical protein
MFGLVGVYQGVGEVGSEEYFMIVLEKVFINIFLGCAGAKVRRVCTFLG